MPFRLNWPRRLRSGFLDGRNTSHAWQHEHVTAGWTPETLSHRALIFLLFTIWRVIVEAERLGSASLELFFKPLSKKERFGDTLYFCVAARSTREGPGDAGEIKTRGQTADESATSLHVRVCTLVFLYLTLLFYFYT